jgi:signal transduction histidine kinase
MEENISKLQFRKRDLDSLIRDLVEEKISWYANTDIKVNYNLESWISKNIEESSFNIIIENLISNAVKFSEEPIKIDVSLNNKRFSIKDYGSWMSETEQKKVWEKFYRKDTKVEWFGIWLYLVKRIVSLYKWSIDLESKKDKYTEFTILFNNH